MANRINNTINFGENYRAIKKGKQFWSCEELTTTENGTRFKMFGYAKTANDAKKIIEKRIEA